LQPQLAYKITDWLVGRIGYRHLYNDIEGDSGEFDGVLHGVILGVGWAF